jgi:hypothetical protein
MADRNIKAAAARFIRWRNARINDASPVFDTAADDGDDIVSMRDLGIDVAIDTDDTA